MDAGGNGQTSITPNDFTDCTGTPPNPETCFSGHDDDPAWSPDGLKIAYVHEQAPNGGGPPNIWTMDPSGANKDNLSDSAVSFINPAWSPQGDMLAAVGTAPATTNRDIWTMKSDGGGQTPVEPNAAHDINPDWGVPAPPPGPRRPPERATDYPARRPRSPRAPRTRPRRRRRRSSSPAPTRGRSRASSAASTASRSGPAPRPTPSRSRRASTPSRSGPIDQAGNVGTPASDNWKVKKKKRR